MEATEAPLPEPTRGLPADALPYWRIRMGLEAGVGLVPALVLAGVLPGPWRWLVVVAYVAAAVAAVAVLPGVRYRRWRYDVRPEEIDIRHGTFVVRRTVVPIRRVQHVDTEAGPLRNAFGLATVAFHTAAGETEIPALARGEAELVRSRIARLARGLDDV